MKIFLSYCTPDLAPAQRVADYLTHLQHEVQMTPPAPNEQATWAYALQSIAGCSLFVLIASRQTIYSQARQIEYLFALTMSKRILSVVIEPDVLELLPEPLKAIQPVLLGENDNVNVLMSQAIQHLPLPYVPSSSMMPPYPNLVAALAPLYAQAAQPSPNPPDQLRLIENLTDLLERQETFQQALAALTRLRNDPDLTPAAAEAIGSTLDEFSKRGMVSRMTARHGFRWLFVAALVIAVIAFVIILNINGGLSPSIPTPVPVAIIEPTKTHTSTATLTLTSTPTYTPTPTATATLTFTPSATSTSTPTATPSVTPSQTPTVTPSATTTFTPSATFTATPSATFTSTPTATSTPSATPTVTPSPRPTNTATVLPTNTRIPATATALPIVTNTRVPTATVTRTLTPSFVATTYTGIQVEDSADGVRIAKLSDAAAETGIEVGDYIDGVDFTVVSSKDDFTKALQDKQPYNRINLRLRRGTQVQFILITLDAFDFVPSTATPTP